MSCREWIASLFAEEDRPERCLFRFDAGREPGVSFGHASRCIILANLLAETFGTRSVALVKDYGGIDSLSQEIPIESLPKGMDNLSAWERTIEFAVKSSADWLVSDLPPTDKSWLKPEALGAAGIHTLYIDDSRFYAPGVDVYLNSSLRAKERMKGATGAARFLLGPEYFLFDSSRSGSRPREYGKDMCNVLVTFGGSDPTGVMPAFAEALTEHRWRRVRFHLHIGPGYGGAEAIPGLTEKGNGWANVLNAPGNLVPYLEHCDFAICSGGRTMHELHHLGKKMIPIATALHEQEEVAAFVREGLTGRGFMKWNPKTVMNAVHRTIKEVMQCTM